MQRIKFSSMVMAYHGSDDLECSGRSRYGPTSNRRHSGPCEIARDVAEGPEARARLRVWHREDGARAGERASERERAARREGVLTCSATDSVTDSEQGLDEKRMSLHAYNFLKKL